MNIEFSIAHFLDPNSKGMCFVDEGEKFEEVKTAVKKAMEELSKKEILASHNTPSPLMLDDEDDDTLILLNNGGRKCLVQVTLILEVKQAPRKPFLMKLKGI